MSNGEIPVDRIIAEELTWREQEVLQLLADRLTNREIADQLHLAESTVKDYVGNILSKLYVKNRRQAVERAEFLGLLDDDHTQIKLPFPNLPAEPTPFIGRKNELANIKELLEDTRLLTLIGPGGIGKSRLALKAAKELSKDYRDGVFFIPLAAINSTETINQTIAENLGFPMATNEDPQIQLIRYLRNKHLLLVLDNFEHLLEGTYIVSEIIQTSPGVKILATSREKLNLKSETILIIDGMPSPDIPIIEDIKDFDAVALFIQSANKVCPRFTPVKEQIVSIAKISHMVQGMPLAIELSAAWMQIISIDEIVMELEKGLDILITEARDTPKRHRSMRNVFDHSWSLLDQEEKAIFLKLSVFRGGFTREAALHVANASLRDLMDLVNKSLISRDPESGRLEIHELLRQYAQERLRIKPEAYRAVVEAHAEYYADSMNKHWELLKGSRQLDALAAIESDLENIRAAFNYYLNQKNTSQTLKFIFAFWMIHWIRGWNLAGVQLFGEVARIFESVEIKEEAKLRGLTLAFQGYFLAWLDSSELGYKLCKESISILEGYNLQEALVFTMYSLCINCYFQNRYAEQIRITREMLELAAEIGDKWLLVFTYFAAGLAAIMIDDFSQARQFGNQQLELCEEIGDQLGSTLPLILLGHSALGMAENELARSYYLRCKKISRKTGFQYSFQTSSKYLAKVDLSMGRLSEAEKNLEQCLNMTIEIGFVRDVVNLFYEYARLRAARGELEGAVELLAFVCQHPVSIQSRMLEGRIRDSAKALLSELEMEMDQRVYLEAMLRGEELELEEIVSTLIKK